jgi:hypothetical protein
MDRYTVLVGTRQGTRPLVRTKWKLENNTKWVLWKWVRGMDSFGKSTAVCSCEHDNERYDFTQARWTTVCMSRMTPVHRVCVVIYSFPTTNFVICTGQIILLGKFYRNKGHYDDLYMYLQLEWGRRGMHTELWRERFLRDWVDVRIIFIRVLGSSVMIIEGRWYWLKVVTNDGLWY